MDRLLCSLLIAPKGKKRRTIPITFNAKLPCCRLTVRDIY
jgi:hypothetical protein